MDRCGCCPGPVAPIELTPGRSTILRTPSPFRTVSASNPEVADVTPHRSGQRPILLPCRYIDDELGELGGVAWTFAVSLIGKASLSNIPMPRTAADTNTTTAPTRAEPKPAANPASPPPFRREPRIVEDPVRAAHCATNRKSPISAQIAVFEDNKSYCGLPPAQSVAKIPVKPSN